jgi:hypothetical protein
VEVALSAVTPKPTFRIHLNGKYVPNINVRRTPDGEGNELLVKFNDELGWIPIYDDDAIVLEYQDETAWNLLPAEIKRNSQDRG